MNARSHIRRLVGVALAAGILIVSTGTGAVAVPTTPADVTVAPASAAAGAPSATADREGPQFYSGVSVDVSGTVDGDVYAAAQSVTISGDVKGDVIAAAQTITITGTVDGNVRLAGQQVTVSGDVSRSGTIASSDLIVSDTGSFGADVVATASSIRIAGEVGRDLQVSVASLAIDGTVGGDVTYTSDSAARIDDGAVNGVVKHVEPTQSPKVEISPWAVLIGWLLGLLYALVALSLVTVFAGLLIPRWLENVTDNLFPSPWRALLVGFVASIVVPFALLFLLVTIVGAPVALAVGLVWVVLILATFVHSAYYLGRLVLRGSHHPVVKALVGGLILIVALQIPWLNILVWLAMVFFGLGAQLLAFQRQRPWRTAAKSPAVTEAETPAGSVR